MENPPILTLDDITVVEATLSDADSVGKFENSQLLETHGGKVPNLESSQEYARRFVSQPQNKYYFVKHKGTGRLLAGGGTSVWLCPYYYRRSHLQAFYSLEEIRGMHMNSLLQFEVIRYLYSIDVNYVEGYIHSKNKKSLENSKRNAKRSGFGELFIFETAILVYSRLPNFAPTWNEHVEDVQRLH